MAIDIWTPRAAYEDSDNDQSLVTRVTFAGTRLLLLGDAEDARTQELLGGGYDLSCDILKIAHHGRYHETSAALLDAAAPRYALITDSQKIRPKTTCSRCWRRAAYRLCARWTGKSACPFPAARSPHGWSPTDRHGKGGGMASGADRIKGHAKGRRTRIRRPCSLFRPSARQIFLRRVVRFSDLQSLIAGGGDGRRGL